MDYTATYTHLNEEIDKRYLKPKTKKTLTLTGTPEEAARAARVLTWYVARVKLPSDRFERGFVSDLSKDLNNSLLFFLDSGTESLFMIAGFLLLGGGLYAWSAYSGEDLGYPPDYPEVP